MASSLIIYQFHLRIFHPYLLHSHVPSWMSDTLTSPHFYPTAIANSIFYAPPGRTEKRSQSPPLVPFLIILASDFHFAHKVSLSPMKLIQRYDKISQLQSRFYRKVREICLQTFRHTVSKGTKTQVLGRFDLICYEDLGTAIKCLLGLDSLSTSIRPPPWT